MVLLSHKLSLGISDHHPAGVRQHNAPPFESTQLLNEGLNTRPGLPPGVITGKRTFYHRNATLFTVFLILLDFTLGTSTGKKEYGADSHQYHQGESHKETKLKTMYHCLPLRACSQLR